MIILGTRNKTFDAMATFLPYQQAAILHEHPVLIWEKSRRVGATYSMAYRAVRRGAMNAVPQAPKSWFSSADDTAAAEYIDYCAYWARKIQVRAEQVNEALYDSENDIQSRALILSNGNELHALTSNAKQFRSKGGDGYWDEAAHHDDALKMWRALQAIKTWGGTLTILSTHNGPNSLFNRFIEDIKQGRRKRWALHKTTIIDAVNDGMLYKIKGKKPTKADIKDWLEELREDCYDDETWQQEYMCVPIDEGTAFLPYELLYACEREGILCETLQQLAQCKGPLYLGMDIGRHKHLTVFFVLEDTSPTLVTRKITIMEKRPFSDQDEALEEYLALPNMRRAALDATGMGEQLAEEAVKRHGEYKVDAVKFTPAVKESMAHLTKRKLEDRNLLLPNDFALREDFHSIRRIVSANGNTRFDVHAPERLGHADRFWAGSLAVSASEASDATPPFVATAQKRKNQLKSRRMLGRFSDLTFRGNRNADF